MIFKNKSRPDEMYQDSLTLYWSHSGWAVQNIEK